MARSSDLSLPSRPLRLVAAAAVALAITALVVMVLSAIGQAATEQLGGTTSRIDIWHLLRMTSIQAGLTTILSLIVGTLLAWALNRLTFPGRGILVGLFASAIVTPGIIVAFGLLTVWGRSGWVAEITEMVFGTPWRVPLFGLGGILAAHVILDGAFAARVILARLDTVPTPRLKTGQSLSLSAWRRFSVIDWPAIRSTLPGLAAIIFLLAFTSFPIVLLLGGGPSSQTLEVAIYSAVRLDFDLSAAVRLAVVQIAVCGLIILVASSLAPVPSALGHAALSAWRDRPAARFLQWLILIACTIGFGLPLIAVLVGGIGPGLAQLLSRETFWAATWSSLIIAGCSAALTLVLALAITMGRSTTTRPLFRIGVATPAYAYLAVPAVALALGFFLIVREMGLAPGRAAPVVIVVANALLALPFAIATLAPPLEAIARTQGRLIRSLGLSGWRQFALIEWPLIGRDVGIVLALAFCFSLGDLGVIALFGTQDFATLPLLMLRALGSYRTADAASVAAIMLALTIVAFVALPRLVEGSPMLELDSLAYAHPNYPPYSFTLRAEPGEITAVSGPSGSGKSTLLDLIAGFLAPTSGKLTLDGKDLLPLAPEQRPISILFQSETLFEHLTAAKNVALGLPPNTPGVTLRKSVNDALAEVNLPDIGRQRASTLSGGQKQRVALARTLLRNRPILLLDEPFSALDDAARTETRTLVRALTEKHKWTTILVSHHADDIAALAAKRYRIERGTLLGS